MNQLSVQRKYLVLLTYWVVLLATLAPTISRVLAASHDVTWTQICSMSGTRWVATTQHDEKAPHPTTLHLDHCPFCRTPTGSWGLPPSNSLVAVAIDAPYFYNPVVLEELFFDFTWAQPPSRAPPAHLATT